MFNFSINRNVIIRLSIAFLFTILMACENGNTDPNAYLNVSIKGSDSGSDSGNNTQSKSDGSNPSYSQDGSVNILPADITRVDFNITDSNDEQISVSLPVGNKTENISIRVAPNRNLVIEIEALTGDTVSFRGQTRVSALRPGQSFPLSVSLSQVDAPTNTATLNISQTGNSKFEGDSGLSNITFTVTLTSPTIDDVTVSYTTNSLSAIADLDYSPTTGILRIPTGELSATINVPIMGDTDQEADETFELTLSGASGNSILGTATATAYIISDDFPGRLNDTGIVLCGDYSVALTNSNSGATNNNSDICAISGTTQAEPGVDLDEDPIPAGQDALYGRDASENDDSNGSAGFDFTKLDADGSPLADQTLDYATQPWACVKDNYTGLIWEVKTTSGLQDTSSRYAWLNTTGTNDGGSAGAVGNISDCVSNIGCNTEAYVTDMNTATSCGATNWRMPTVTELLSIVDNSRANPAIDVNFFPNSASSYWSSSPQAFNNSTAFYAWGVNFSLGYTQPLWIQGTFGNSIRLVHDEAISQQF